MIIAERNAPHAHCARIVDGQRRESIGNCALQVIAATELAAATATRHCQRWQGMRSNEIEVKTTIVTESRK